MENYFYRKLVFAKAKSGGTSNYADLANKPQINGVTLDGNKTSEDLGIEQGVTEEVLTQALAAESAARQKQDELLQGEIEGKIAAANILAGENIEVSQEGNNVTVSSTAEGKTYTAGTNIEITEDGVINNTIPYSKDGWSMAIGEGSYVLSTGCTAVGTYSHIGSNSDESVAFGLYSSGSKYGVAVGSRTEAAHYGVAIGHRNDNSAVRFGSISIGAQDIPSNSGISNASIAIGTNALAPNDNQFVLGSTAAPINEMVVVTSDGEKYIATTDLIPEETPIATTELVGKVKPDGTSITIDEDGTLHSVGVTQEYVNNIVSQLQTKITELEAKVTALESSTSETS